MALEMRFGNGAMIQPRKEKAGMQVVWELECPQRVGTSHCHAHKDNAMNERQSTEHPPELQTDLRAAIEAEKISYSK